MAPLIADGVVITGISGAEYGIRGFLDGWDPETGKHLWRTYTMPGPGIRTAKAGQAIPISMAAAPPGSPGHSIPICTPSTGAPATPDHGIPQPIPATISILVRYWRSTPRPAS